MSTSYRGLANFLSSPPFQATEERLKQILPTGAARIETGKVLSDGTNYIICYAPRSGSTHLISLLQHTNILGKPSDFLNLDYVNLETDAEQLYRATGGRDIGSACKLQAVRSVEDFLQSVAAATRTPNGVFGLKADLYQSSMLMRRGLFGDARISWKYIYLTREDVLMQAISYYRAIQTGKWSSISSAEPRDCEFDEDGILRCVRTITEIMCGWEYAFALFGIRPLRFTYESLEADPRGALERLVAFTGVPYNRSALPLLSAYSRQRSPKHDEWAARIRANAAIMHPYDDGA